MLNFGKYVYAPAGNVEARTDKILHAVEYIGSMQDGCGSDYAKGKRYLRCKIPGCSGRAIKRTVKIGVKIFNNDYQREGYESYFYHEEMSVRIIEEIISFLKKNNVDMFYDSVDRVNIEPSLGEYLYGHRKNHLMWVVQNDYMEQGERAEKIAVSLRAMRMI